MTRYATRPTPVDLFVGPPHAALLNTTGTFPSANAAMLNAFQVSRPVTVSTAYFRVGVQSGNMDIGIYSDAGVLLASTGSFAAPASGQRSQALSASARLVPGRRYWLAIAADNTTVTFGNFGGAPSPTVPGYIRVGKVATSFPLPSTIAIPTDESADARPYALYLA